MLTRTDNPVLKRASLTMSSHAVTGDSARIDWTLAGARLADIGQFRLRVKDRDDRTLLRQEMTREARSSTMCVTFLFRLRYWLKLKQKNGRGIGGFELVKVVCDFVHQRSAGIYVGLHVYGFKSTPFRGHLGGDEAVYVHCEYD